MAERRTQAGNQLARHPEEPYCEVLQDAAPHAAGLEYYGEHALRAGDILAETPAGRLPILCGHESDYPLYLSLSGNKYPPESS